MNNKQPIADTIKSVLAALLGVQSNQNRERDFTQGKFSHFVIIGLIVVILFVLSLISIVSWVTA
ncbi:DUF2970 domain-containing protein [Thalassotalea ganghwensis]